MLVLFLTHIPSTYFGGLPPLHHTRYLQLNQKWVSATLSAVYVTEEVVEKVVVAYQFSMKMVPLLVVFFARGTITGSATTVLSMVRVLLSNTFVNTVEAPFPSCAFFLN